MTNDEMNQKLINHFMGTGYYIVDPLQTNQANDIIYEEIIKAYPHPIHQYPRRWGLLYNIYQLFKRHYDF